MLCPYTSVSVAAHQLGRDSSRQQSATLRTRISELMHDVIGARTTKHIRDF